MISLLRIDYNLLHSGISIARKYPRDSESSSLKLEVCLPILATHSTKDVLDKNHIGMIFAAEEPSDETKDTVLPAEIPIGAGENAGNFPTCSKNILKYRVIKLIGTKTSEYPLQQPN